MSQSPSPRKFVDVDRTVLEPSPQRVRNILTLEERVQAIYAYDCRPMYTKVAKMFNCSWEQIRNIINHRDAILEFYYVTKNRLDVESDPHQDAKRQQNITFLGECLYEYIQRKQYYTQADITEELLRTKAIEFRDLIQIENFIPNKAWINHFKATYNFSLSNRQIILTRIPPRSLNLKDIITYCNRNKATANSSPAVQEQSSLYRTKTRADISNANTATLEELMKRKQRKIDCLETALDEYVQRLRYHQKRIASDEMLMLLASDFGDLLKIDDFCWDRKWLGQFKIRTNFSQYESEQWDNSRTPPFPLDLRDILSYCNRMKNKSQQQSPVTIKLAPKESTPRPIKLNLARLVTSQTIPFSISAATSDEAELIIDGDPEQIESPEELEEEELRSPLAKRPRLSSPHNENDAKELKTPFSLSTLQRSQRLMPPTWMMHSSTFGLPKITSVKTIDLTDDVNMKVTTTTTAGSNGPLKKPYGLHISINGVERIPQLKIRRIETMREATMQPTSMPPIPLMPILEPEDNNSPDQDSIDNSAACHQSIETVDEALNCVQQLEMFALLRKNFRAAAMLGRIEELFKNHRESSEEEDEDEN